MPLAKLKAKFTNSAIETDAGIIRGVHVMELGKVATFADEKGKPKTVKITDAHISALMNHAGNRAIPMHWSHDWFEKNEDPLHARVGALKDFRKDDSANLVADAHLAPGKYRDTALWSAENDPENIMLSAVFDYAKTDKNCIPRDFQACDLVSNGAATTALLEETKNSSMPLTIDDLKTLLADPEAKTLLRGAMDAHDDMQDDAAAAMESDAGVTDADKKDGDSQKPVLMRAFLRSQRAIKRQIAADKSEAIDKTALMAEVKVLAAAEVTGALGKSGFIGITATAQETDQYTALLATYTAAAKDPVQAARRLLHDHPELLDAHAAHTRARMATMKPAN